MHDIVSHKVRNVLIFFCRLKDLLLESTYTHHTEQSSIYIELYCITKMHVIVLSLTLKVHNY